jgi:cell wall-associated NlpC family hydrolase
MSQSSRRDRGEIHLALAVGVAVVLLLPVLLLGALSGLLSQQASACQDQPPPASLAVSTIPASYLTLYQEAGQEYGIPWEVLAGTGEVESDHGRSDAPGVHSGANAYGAAGPMQFGIGGAAGNTWGGAPIHPASEKTSGYGIDGDHDGQVNVYDPGDAIPSAAGFLTAHGAPGNMQAALLAYNNSPDYAALVLHWATRYASGGARAVSASDSTTCEQAAAGPLPAGTAGKIIAYTEQQLGKPYLWGGTGPDAYDCSGLAMMAYRAAGIAIPRTSQQQWAYGPRIPAAQVQPGDLVFFAGSDGTWTAPGHVGIVVSKDKMIDAPYSGQNIRFDTFSGSSVVGYTSPATRA